MKNKKFVGLSLSYCVRDIAIFNRSALRNNGIGTEGLPYESVFKVVASTAITSEADMQAVFKRYAQNIWSSEELRTGKTDQYFVATCVQIMRRLFEEGKVEQPALKKPLYVRSIVDGHWLDVESYYAEEYGDDLVRNDLASPPVNPQIVPQ